MTEVTIKFVNSPNYAIIGATGAVGNFTPNGMILCNLFIEHQIVNSVSIKLDDTGKPLSESYESNTFVRENQVGILFDRAVAKAIGEWLIKLADTKLSGEA